MNFWHKLPKPFFALAPMANVTDSVFRRLIAKYGKPDVLYTEFVSAEGLLSEGRERLLVDLRFTKKEKPIVAQIFCGNPEKTREAARLVAKLGFDGLDINMGCPDRSVEKQGAGAALIRDPKKALMILEEARAGFVGRGKSNAVSVKTRIGYIKIDLDWIRLLLGQKLPALTVHLRTRKEMSLVPAHWELMPEIVKMRDEISPETLIIGNGDVADVAEGILKCEEYGCDGIMIGRGIFGKPWLFRDIDKISRSSRPSSRDKCRLWRIPSKAKDEPNEDISSRRGGSDERLSVLLEHARLFEKEFKGVKNFDVMKKHFKAYVSGWKGAKELRAKLMMTKSSREVNKVLEIT